MAKCPTHQQSYTIRTGEKDGKPWTRWSCNAKEGSEFCKEGEWGRGKTVAEEMANKLNELCDLIAKNEPSF